MRHKTDRYFVGHLITDEVVARYYKHLTTNLSERFGIKNLSLHTPPHLTLKPPFESGDTALFKELLGEIAGEERSIPLTIEGFGSFTQKDGGGIVYLAVRKSGVIQAHAERIVDRIAEFGEGKNLLRRPLTLHVSVARFLSPEDMGHVQEYLKNISLPQFDLVLNNITLFRHISGRWEVEEVFPLLG
ncbi:MAG: 2'-5' RNA ligase family protein [Candidatus Pacebacteria bacterium]|nr:2'-5' RNA ligase family protein [Candidatus Paceibacterota bacterium]